MDWFRWWHGTVTDPKFQSVARKTGYPVGSVIAVWAALLECASDATRCNADATRGNVASFHCNDFDVLLGFEDGTVQSIFDAMTDRGLIADGEIAKWNDRQPKREDSGNPNTGALSSTERSRLHRDRKKRTETQCNDMQRDATLGNDRLDKSREEEKEKEEPLSGKPDRDEAKAILDYLNAKAGREYRAVESNLRLIDARLKSGVTVEQCKAIVDAKVSEWTGTDRDKYLRPETLFGATKFEQYLGQLTQTAVVVPAESAAMADGATFIPGYGKCY